MGTFNMDKIEEYFVDLRIVDGAYSIRVSFPEKWTMIKLEGVDVSRRKVAESNGNIVYTFTDKGNNGEGFDLVESIYEVVKYNLELMQKAELLKSKIEELKRLFIEKDYDELLHITFEIGDKELKRKGRKTKSKKADDEVCDDLCEAITTDL